MQHTRWWPAYLPQWMWNYLALKCYYSFLYKSIVFLKRNEWDLILVDILLTQASNCDRQRCGFTLDNLYYHPQKHFVLVIGSFLSFIFCLKGWPRFVVIKEPYFQGSFQHPILMSKISRYGSETCHVWLIPLGKCMLRLKAGYKYLFYYLISVLFSQLRHRQSLVVTK